MKRQIVAFVSVIVLTITATVGVLAAGGAIDIKAVLDTGITIKLNGETKALNDSAGNAVSPIIYNGTTYLPVRAVAGLFNVDVDWDATTRSVLLGNEVKSDAKETLLSSLKISSASGRDNTKVIDVIKDKYGNVYRNSVCVNTYNGVGSRTTYAEYFFNKQYSKLTLTLVPEENFKDNVEVKFYVDGDSKNLWTSDMLNYKSALQTIEIDVTGQDYVRFAVDYASAGYIILGNATLSK